MRVSEKQPSNIQTLRAVATKVSKESELVQSRLFRPSSSTKKHTFQAQWTPSASGDKTQRIAAGVVRRVPLYNGISKVVFASRSGIHGAARYAPQHRTFSMGLPDNLRHLSDYRLTPFIR